MRSSEDGRRNSEENRKSFDEKVSPSTSATEEGKGECGITEKFVTFHYLQRLQLLPQPAPRGSRRWIN